MSLDCSGQFVLRAYEGDDKPVCADKQILAVSGLLIDVLKMELRLIGNDG